MKPYQGTSKMPPPSDSEDFDEYEDLSVKNVYQQAYVPPTAPKHNAIENQIIHDISDASEDFGAENSRMVSGSKPKWQESERFTTHNGKKKTFESDFDELESGGGFSTAKKARLESLNNLRGHSTHKKSAFNESVASREPGLELNSPKSPKPLLNGVAKKDEKSAINKKVVENDRPTAPATSGPKPKQPPTVGQSRAGDDWGAQVAVLTDRLKILGQEKAELQQRCLELEQKLSVANVDNCRLQGDLFFVRERSGALERERDEAIDRAKALTQSLEEKATNLTSIFKKSEKVKLEEARVSKEAELRHKTKETMNIQLHLQEEVAEYRQKLEDAMERVERGYWLEKENERLTRQVTEQQRLLDLFKKEKAASLGDGEEAEEGRVEETIILGYKLENSKLRQEINQLRDRLKAAREEVEGKGPQNSHQKMAELQNTIAERNEAIFRLQKTLEEVETRLQDQLTNTRKNLEATQREAAQAQETNDQLAHEIEAVRARELRKTGTLESLAEEKREWEDRERRFGQWLATETEHFGRRWGVHGLAGEARNLEGLKKEISHFLSGIGAEMQSREANFQNFQVKTASEKLGTNKNLAPKSSDSLKIPSKDVFHSQASDGHATMERAGKDGVCLKEGCLRLREVLEIQVRRLKQDLVTCGGKNQMLEEENQRLIEIVRQSPKNLTQIDIELFEQRLINLERSRRRQDQEITQALIGTQSTSQAMEISCGHDRLIADLRKSVSDKNGCIMRLRSEMAHLLEQIKVLKG